ncbi:MAG: thioredoxin domain-containing protein [Pseudomonadota bacterium]
MFHRIFMVILFLVCAALAYSIVQVSLAKHSAQKTEHGYVSGERDSDLTLIEFIDYACGQCQNLHPILMRSLEQDGDILYVVRPVFSGPDENGTKAGRLVYAAERQGKFAEAHKILIENYRTIDEAYINSLVQVLELDGEQLRADMADEAIDEMLMDNTTNLQRLGGRVIPSLLLNGELMVQVAQDLPSSQELLGLFNRARAL